MYAPQLFGARKYTNRLLEMVEEGLLSADDVLTMAVSYMSESEVEDMCDANDLSGDMFPEDFEVNDEE